jgi:hypothetical protein
MSIQWDSLLAVFVVSLSSTVAIVALVTLAMLGLSVRTPRVVRSDSPTRQELFSPVSRTIVAGACLAGACLAGAVAIVLFGLWAIVAR